MSDTKSAQLRVADGYARLVVDAGGRSWSVAVDHATGGAAIGWGWSVTSLEGEDVLLAGTEPTWAAALRKAFRAAERAALEAASVRPANARGMERQADWAVEMARSDPQRLINTLRREELP